MREENVASFLTAISEAAVAILVAITETFFVKWVCFQEVTKLIAVLDLEIIFPYLLQCSRIPAPVHIIKCCRRRIYERKCRDKYYCVIDYAEGNVQDKKSQGTDTLAPLLRKIGHL